MRGIRSNVPALPDHQEPSWCAAQVRLVERYNVRHPSAKCFGDLLREQMTANVGKDELKLDATMPPKSVAKEGSKRDRKRSRVLAIEIDRALDEKLPGLAGQVIGTDALLALMPRRLRLECGEASLRVRIGLRLGARGHGRFATEVDCGKGRSKWRIVKEKHRRR